MNGDAKSTRNWPSTDRSTHKTQLKIEKLDTFQLHYILAKNINNYIYS